MSPKILPAIRYRDVVVSDITVGVRVIESVSLNVTQPADYGLNSIQRQLLIDVIVTAEDGVSSESRKVQSNLRGIVVPGRCKRYVV